MYFDAVKNFEEQPFTNNLLRYTGSASIRATQWIINASYNQSQRFFHLNPEPQML
jgi:hypothetical protein